MLNTDEEAVCAKLSFLVSSREIKGADPVSYKRKLTSHVETSWCFTGFGTLDIHGNPMETSNFFLFKWWYYSRLHQKRVAPVSAWDTKSPALRSNACPGPHQKL